VSTERPARFAHRLTENSRFESICLQCFRTVANAELEPGLNALEADHVCAEEDTIRLHGKRGPASVGSGARKQDLA
jgi:hypothetical protein